MKQVTCKNCGAVFSESLEKCPYCGTMNKKGAYRKFRQKISDMIDAMLGLKEEAHRSVSKMIFISLLRGIVLIAAVVLLAFLFSRFANVNYYNDREYDEEALETILWEDENLEKLDEAYANEDFKTIEKLYYENSRVVSHWAHYPSYTLKKQFKMLTEDDKFDHYDLDDALYFLFYPESITGFNGMARVDREEYELMRGSLLTMLNQKGFSEAKLEEIYRKHCDEYGYIRSSDLEEYFKEGTNG
ncbi:MAG: hypothetical protein IIZ28_00175 [Erysipelotrichaceae bacterium]|nr:hypothetical protein [Erysipelotrichaceae bacterium]